MLLASLFWRCSTLLVNLMMNHASITITMGDASSNQII